MDGSSKSRVDWTAAAFAAALAYTLFLIAMFVGHFWLRDSNGHILANDFIDVYAAGNLASAGHAAQLYDWDVHRAAELAITAIPFDGYYGWHYPPPFLFVATALSRLPYLAAFLLWIAVTLPLYALAVSRIAQKPEAILWACAFPAVLMDAYVGQNGLLTAALLGGMLLTLEEQPLLGGVFLGLLTYKPQFGVLLPFALLAGGYWRTLASGMVMTAAMVLVSFLVFGHDTWIAFFQSIPHTTDIILAQGHAGWNKLQTAYGFVRWVGASDRAAWDAQVSLAVLMLLGIVFMWRSKMPFALKAAALCTATLLATPYAYIYDFPILAVAIAFLYRDHAFSAYETAVLFAVAALIVFFPWADAPIGFGASLMMASLVSRRGRQMAMVQRDVALQHA